MCFDDSALEFDSAKDGYEARFLYFHEDEPQSAWPGALALAWDVAKTASRPESSESVRVAGLVLQGAIHDLLSLLGESFLQMRGEQDDEKLLASYAADHFRQELRSG